MGEKVILSTARGVVIIYADQERRHITSGGFKRQGGRREMPFEKRVNGTTFTNRVSSIRDQRSIRQQGTGGYTSYWEVQVNRRRV